jgi:hypothetical protein
MLAAPRATNAAAREGQYCEPAWSISASLHQLIFAAIDRSA